MANSLTSGTGIQLNIGGKTESIPLRAIPTVSGANANVAENESYTLNVITGNRRTGILGGRDQRQWRWNATFVKPIDNIGAKTIPNYAAYANQFIYTDQHPGLLDPRSSVFVGSAGRCFRGEPRRRLRLRELRSD